MVRQLVSVDRGAWHAGRSEMYVGETYSNVNQRSIGIGLGNLGLLLGDPESGFEYELGATTRGYPRGRVPPKYGVLQYDDQHKVSGWWEPYQDKQIDGLVSLLNGIYEACGELPLVGHEEIGMPLGRKCDPGSLFPWHELTEFPRLTPRCWVR